MDRSTTKRFSIALSFPGQRRSFVENVAENLAKVFTKDQVLYDKYYEAEFAQLDLDVYLPNLYKTESELIVIFLGPEYKDKRWCRLEWRFIKQLISTIDQHRIMLLSFGDPGDLTDLGILRGDGYVDIGGRQPDEISNLILQRYEHNSTLTIPPYALNLHSNLGQQKESTTESKQVNHFHGKQRGGTRQLFCDQLAIKWTCSSYIARDSRVR